MPLTRIIYVSTPVLCRDPDDERRQIADILLVSRRNNAERDITGALLFSDSRFAQVLEGKGAVVKALYDTLARDPRHRNLVLLLSEEVAHRSFPQWGMAYIGPSQSADEAVERVTAAVGRSDAGARARELVSFMGRMLAASTTAAAC